MTAILDQKHYIEELNRHLSGTVTDLQAKMDSLEKTNSKLVEEVRRELMSDCCSSVCVCVCLAEWLLSSSSADGSNRSDQLSARRTGEAATAE